MCRKSLARAKRASLRPFFRPLFDFSRQKKCALFCTQCTLPKNPFLLALRQNVPGGEERGETDVFAGYSLLLKEAPDIGPLYRYLAHAYRYPV